MLAPAIGKRGHLSLALTLLIFTVRLFSYLPLMQGERGGEGEGEVWFEDVLSETEDTNEDNATDTANFDYDVDTDGRNATEVTVKLYVWDSSDHVAGDTASSHRVANNTTE